MTDLTENSLDIEPGLYEIQENGDMYKLDFDIINEEAIKNKIEEKENMSKEDIKEKAEEKAEITEDIEDSSYGKKEVYNDEGFAEQTVKVCRKKLDFLEKQAEELKALKAEKDTVEKEYASFKKDFAELKESIEKERAAKIESKRQKKIEQMAHDFDLPKEKLAEKSYDMLIEYEELLDLAIKREEEPSEGDFEISKPDETIEQRINDMKKAYKLDI